MYKSLLKFWRHSLADEARLGLSRHEFTRSMVVSRSLLQEYLPTEITNELLGRQSEAEPVAKTVTVFVLPYIARRQRNHMVKKDRLDRVDEIFPLWIAAQLQHDGRLLPTQRHAVPWIDRRIVAPNESMPCTIASLDEIDNYLLHKPMLIQTFLDEDKPHRSPWEQLYSYAMKFIEQVTKSRWTNILNDSHFEILDDKCLIAVVENYFGPAYEIISIIDSLLKPKAKLPPLLNRYLDLGQVTPQAPSQDAIATLISSQQHSGHMALEKPLAESQRQALHCILQSEENEMLAIQGPPGTGKTTLIQSIISSLWVKAALAQTKPPLIVVSSTNNQAIMNVLQCLQPSTINVDQPKAQRWLPELDNCGVYLPTNNQAKINLAEQKNLEYLTRSNHCHFHGNLLRLYRSDYQQQAKTFFLKQVQQCYGEQETSLTAAQADLHQRLLAAKSAQDEILDRVKQLLTQQVLVQDEFSSLAECRDQLDASSQTLTQLSAQQQKLKHVKKRMLAYLTKASTVGLRMLFAVPAFKTQVVEQLNLILHDEFPSHLIQSVEQAKHLVNEKLKSVQTQLTKQQAWHERWQTIFNDFQQTLSAIYQFDQIASVDRWQASSWCVEVEFIEIDINRFLQQLDIITRFEMHTLAMHYWEATWLLEQTTQEEPKKYTRKEVLERWHTWSMIMPCFATTMHSGPGFFYYCHQFNNWRHLTASIDYLIIDEAGQVNPALAVGMLSLAKRAIVIGDIKQLEPVVRLPLYVEFCNAKQATLVEDQQQFQQMLDRGVIPSGDRYHCYGSVMRMAMRLSPYDLCLREHWRCVPGVIAYCNELAYQNNLIIKRKPLTTLPWPPLCYYHLKSECEHLGSSYANRTQALHIAKWIKKHELLLQRLYPGKALKDIVAVITPFARQAALLKTLFKKFELTLENVGTIHSLQGAERPIVIYSTVYSKDQGPQHYFFDTNVNMLNVAVSRAQDCFMVFGDSELFSQNPHINLPSTLLARYLFKDESHAIEVLSLPQQHDLISASARLNP